MGLCMVDLRNAERCQGWRMEACRASRGERQGEKVRVMDIDNATARTSWILFLLRVFLCRVCKFSPFSRFCGSLCYFKNVHFKLLQGRLQVARRQVGRSVLTDTAWAAAPPRLWSWITNWRVDEAQPLTELIQSHLFFFFFFTILILLICLQTTLGNWHLSDKQKEEGSWGQKKIWIFHWL